MRKIDYLVMHCSATRGGQKVTVKDITEWHKARGFRTIGYHYVVYADGTIVEGRPLEEIGAHVAGHNQNSIGICYIGGLDVMGKAKDTRTPEQKKAIRELLLKLRRQYPNAAICGHRDFSPDKNGNGKIEPFEWIKECPCFDAIVEYQDI
jgi:N-acetyl-anhydromuramyl-L-alanine amidase AmpD